MCYMEAALRALVEPRRREILRLVWDHELAAGEIASHFEVTRPAISQHLRVLRRAGLLTERRQGTWRFYRARPQALAEVTAFLEAFWDAGLERLKYHAELEERRAAGHDHGRDKRRHT
jgi:DNA-binding transcriptional ArsR family regulator